MCTSVCDQASVGSKPGVWLTAGHVFLQREMRQMSLKTQTSGGLLFHFYVHPAKSRLPAPEKLRVFWPDLNSEAGPRGLKIAPGLKVESGGCPSQSGCKIS